MSYRTYINDTQVFGNNEYYEEWTDYLESKGIEINEEGCYDGELDDFMEALSVVETIVMHMEKERRENKEKGLNYLNKSIFDLSNIYDDCLNLPESESIFDKELHYLNNGYMFMPYAFFKACEPLLEFKGYAFKGNHTHVYKLKDGCKISVSAG